MLLWWMPPQYDWPMQTYGCPIGQCQMSKIKLPLIFFFMYFVSTFSPENTLTISDISYSYDQLRTFNWDEVSPGHLWKHCHRGASRLELRGQLAASSVPETIKPSSIFGWWNPSFLTLSQVIHSHPIIVQRCSKFPSRIFKSLHETPEASCQSAGVAQARALLGVVGGGGAFISMADFCGKDTVG